MDRDERVCHCFNVTIGDIEKAIKEGEKSITYVRRNTKAGTACGRCNSKMERVAIALIKENK